MNIRQSRFLFSAGCTVILAGYLMVWLPHESAGLSFIGVEIGEWVKFLPQVQAGQITPGRDLFYLPPITLGLIIALFTSGWPNRQGTTWLMRGLAVLVSLLAFPSIDAIRFEPASEWLLRLLMIGLVIVVALASSVISRLDRRIIWATIVLIALFGCLLPSWTFFAVRPAVVELFRAPVRPGSGVWLNATGHLLILAVAVNILRRKPA
jgi:hypothetical protein